MATATATGDQEGTAGAEFSGEFNVQVSGLSRSIVLVQRSFDRGGVANDGLATWETVDTIHNDTQSNAKVYNEPETGVYWRLYIEEFRDTSVALRISN